MNLVNISKYYLDSELVNSNFKGVDLLPEKEKTSTNSPNYNVVLLDDNDHTYDYVIEMLMDIFNHSKRKAFEMACEVDFKGRVIVFSSTKKIAEAKRDEILLYGADWRLKRSKGPMSAIIEPTLDT
ncbi:MAG: ATP-dependent Clp protease adaptor ClpS [Candidatus Dadabacteria bacterium]|nr:ATP-dependent Clp protease adaptor ClpS [Candidatus Dadabacteria bacterium]NIQ15304.1 ATP-dependent Clp protease adaptor ClpS [Candidatus Dadabacteria bacterium]